MRLLILLLFCSVATLAQELQKGVVIPAVQLENSQEKSYALYLPNSYETSQTYPIVVVFDDQGKGAAAVQRFTIGANLTQSIVVSPNYKQSLLFDESLRSTHNFLKTIVSTYSIDTKNIILAGIYDAGLLASVYPFRSPDFEITKVIGVNNVLIDESLIKSRPNVRFVVINKDTGPHYYKLRVYDGRTSFREKLLGYYEYGTTDTWPDAGYLSAAMVDLLKNTDDQAEIESYYNNDLAFGDLLYKKQRALEAFDFIFDLKKKYKNQVDLDLQKELLKRIRSSTTYRVGKLQRNEARFEEQLLLQDFVFFLEEDTQKAFFDNLGWWNFQMDELDATIDSTAQNKQERKAAQRLKSYLNNKVEEKHELYAYNGGTLEQLLFTNILRTLVNPNNQEAFLNCISLSAKEGDANAALFYLEELLRTGYKEYDSLYNIPGTTAVKISQEWNELIKAYLGKSKFYDN